MPEVLRRAVFKCEALHRSVSRQAPSTPTSSDQPPRAMSNTRALSTAHQTHSHSPPPGAPLCRCWLGRGFWYALFVAELPICLATVLYWILAPGQFVAGFTTGGSKAGSHASVDATPMETSLLQQVGNVVFCAYVLFYGRMLISTPNVHTAASSSVATAPPSSCAACASHRAMFLWLQECMCVGDGLVLLQSLYVWWRMQPQISILLAQVGMAGGFGIARIIFLAQQRKADKDRKQS